MVDEKPTWTFLTNHTHVLLAIAADSEIRMRDLADRVGITERAAIRIVAELVDAGYLEITKQGRRNTYKVRRDRPLRHPAESHHRIGDIIKVASHRQ